MPQKRWYIWLLHMGVAKVPVCNKTYAAVIPAEKLRMSKAKTHGIERNHSQQRHWFGR